MKPIKGETSLEIAAPPEVLYDMVADISRMGEWASEATGGRWLGGATGAAVDARFKGTNRGRLPWSTSSRVVAAERGREFGFVRDRPSLFGAVHWRYQFEPTAGGTRVTESFEEVKPASRLATSIAPVASRVKWADRESVNVKNMQDTLRRLKASAEGASER